MTGGLVVGGLPAGARAPLGGPDGAPGFVTAGGCVVRAAGAPGRTGALAGAPGLAAAGGWVVLAPGTPGRAPVLAAITRGFARTRGADTGLPAIVACRTGATVGFATTCVLASCCGATRTTWCATGCPLRNVFTGTAVVATFRFTY